MNWLPRRLVVDPVQLSATPERTLDGGGERRGICGRAKIHGNSIAKSPHCSGCWIDEKEANKAPKDDVSDVPTVETRADGGTSVVVSREPSFDLIAGILKESVARIYV